MYKGIVTLCCNTSGCIRVLHSLLCPEYLSLFTRKKVIEPGPTFPSPQANLKAFSFEVFPFLISCPMKLSFPHLNHWNINSNTDCRIGIVVPPQVRIYWVASYVYIPSNQILDLQCMYIFIVMFPTILWTNWVGEPDWQNIGQKEGDAALQHGGRDYGEIFKSAQIPVRDAAHFQIGWIFEKFRRGGGSFSIQNFTLQNLDL